MGAELEKNGAKMDKKMWCGKCSVDHPELVRKIHEDYINAVSYTHLTLPTKA